MNAVEEGQRRLAIRPPQLPATRRHRTFVALLAACALAILIVANIPDRLPDRVWGHPGHPWCEKCASGVPCWTFRLTPDGPTWDPGWCFSDGLDYGIKLGPPPTPLICLVNGIEEELQNGDHGYYGGVSYVLTGRSETVEGHRWTEYRRDERR